MLAGNEVVDDGKADGLGLGTALALEAEPPAMIAEGNDALEEVHEVGRVHEVRFKARKRMAVIKHWKQR